ncbi:uncharacterized protein LOC111829664 [Capsella rubella]|uniref:uncharacterized protein LOC111829664 n=1 Tax=Capsella rubella TaxID=81985 RepID=UPI000CD52CBB|nr:uncharacterized protein LOC111829664 [Capsella rubella]
MSESSTSSSRRSYNSIASSSTLQLPVRSHLPPALPASSIGHRTASPYSVSDMFPSYMSNYPSGYLTVGYSQGLSIGHYGSLGSGLPMGLHPPSIGETFPSYVSAASYMSGQEQPPRDGYYDYQPHWDWKSRVSRVTTQVEDQPRWDGDRPHELQTVKVNDQPDPLNKGKAHALPPGNSDTKPRWGWRK